MWAILAQSILLYIEIQLPQRVLGCFSVFYCFCHHVDKGGLIKSYNELRNGYVRVVQLCNCLHVSGGECHWWGMWETDLQNKKPERQQTGLCSWLCFECGHFRREKVPQWYQNKVSLKLFVFLSSLQGLLAMCCSCYVKSYYVTVGRRMVSLFISPTREIMLASGGSIFLETFWRSVFTREAKGSFFCGETFHHVRCARFTGIKYLVMFVGMFCTISFQGFHFLDLVAPAMMSESCCVKALVVIVKMAQT